MIGKDLRELLLLPANEPSGVAERNAWAEKYLFTTVKGRIYHFDDMVKLVLAKVRSSPLPVQTGLMLRDWYKSNQKEARKAVASILTDDRFLRPMAGQIPSAVAEAAEERVWSLVRGG